MGLGVGLGVPLVIAVLAILFYLIWRHRHKVRETLARINSKFRNRESGQCFLFQPPRITM